MLRRRPTLLTLCAAVAAATAIAAEIPRLHWDVAHPRPTGDDLFSATWGPAGVIVASGTGNFLFSADAVNWERVATDFPWPPRDSCHAQGKYVVVGNQGAIFWSADGRTWHRAQTPTSSLLLGVAYGDQRFAAVGSDGTLLTSTNAQDWSASPVPPGVSFVDIVFGNGEWLTAGSDGAIRASADLLNWENRYGPHPPGLTPVLHAICHGDRGFLAVGGWPHPGGLSVALHSVDGREWISADLGGLDAWGGFQHCAYGNGTFVAVGGFGFFGSSNVVYYSNDGLVWRKASHNAGSTNLWSAAISPDGLFVAVGRKGEILVSDSGAAWSRVTGEPREWLSSVAHGGGRFIIAGGSDFPFGSSIICSSSNGLDWDFHVPSRGIILHDSAFGNDTWVVTGDDGSIFSSADGLNWEDRSLPPTRDDLRTVVHGSGRFVAFVRGQNLVYISTDGATWSATPTPNTSEVRGAEWLNGHFVAFGDRGAVLYSTDGLEWTAKSVPTTESFMAACHAKNRYILGGFFVLASSADGHTWTVQDAPFQVKSIRYVNGWFLAFGGQASLLASRDGLHWRELPAAQTNFGFGSVASGAGRLVALDGISILASDIPSPGSEFRLEWMDSFELESFGRDGKKYRLFRSPDLRRWVEASDWKLGTGDYLVWPKPEIGAGPAFFRVLESQAEAPPP